MMQRNFFLPLCWLLENTWVHFLSIDFLLWAAHENSRKRLAVWLPANVVLMLIFFALPYSFLVQLLFFLLFAVLLWRLPLRQMLPPAVLLLALCTLKEGFSALILSWASKTVVSSTGGLAEQAGCSLLLALLFSAALRGIKKRYADAFRSPCLTELCPIVFPSLWIVALARLGLRLDAPDFENYLCSLGTGARLLFLLLLSGGAAVLFLIAALLCKTAAAAQNEKKQALLEKQLNWHRISAETAQKQKEVYASFQHDVDNHLLVLSGLLHEKRFSQAEQYLENLQGKRPLFKTACPTGSAVLDVLLSEKLAAAKRLQIQVSCAVTLPTGFEIDRTDLCALFANILDNAITACQKEPAENRSLSLSAGARAGFLLIEAVNPTTARHFRMGTGLHNIRQIAERYGGTMEVSLTNGSFRVSVLLCLRKCLP